MCFLTKKQGFFTLLTTIGTFVPLGARNDTRTNEEQLGFIALRAITPNLHDACRRHAQIQVVCPRTLSRCVFGCTRKIGSCRRRSIAARDRLSCVRRLASFALPRIALRTYVVLGESARLPGQDLPLRISRRVDGRRCHDVG